MALIFHWFCFDFGSQFGSLLEAMLAPKIEKKTSQNRCQNKVAIWSPNFSSPEASGSPFWNHFWIIFGSFLNARCQQPNLWKSCCRYSGSTIFAVPAARKCIKKTSKNSLQHELRPKSVLEASWGRFWSDVGAKLPVKVDLKCIRSQKKIGG